MTNNCCLAYDIEMRGPQRTERLRGRSWNMLVLLPFLIIATGVSSGLCSAIGYTGAALVGMLLLLFAAAFAGSLLLFFLLAWLLGLTVDMNKPQARPNRFYRLLMLYVMALLTTLARIRLQVSGLELLPEGHWLLVCNHRSNFDPIVTGWALRRYDLAFISKPRNFRIPLVGPVIHKAGFLPIDRENDRAALRTIQTAAERLRQGVVSYGIYPEGTRNTGREMLPFRNGAFKIAQKAGTPIVIACIQGSDLVKDRFPWHSTTVRLKICKVLDAETVKTYRTTEIGEEVQRCINSENI